MCIPVLGPHAVLQPRLPWRVVGAQVNEHPFCNIKQVCVQLPTSAVNVALPRLLLRAVLRPVLRRRQPSSNRSIFPTRRAHSSKPAACCCSVRPSVCPICPRCCSGQMGRTDGRFINHALHTRRAVPISYDG